MSNPGKTDAAAARRGKPELLAPAGNLAAALTAFDAGADAVYFGLRKFNARARTENFSVGEMRKLANYARSLGRQTYAAFNTLVRESELDEAAAALAEIADAGVDAVIVQDIGVLRLVREYFPELKLHASTQMGVHNAAGTRVAARMGISRVILERQLTLAETAAVAAASPVEVEVFVHGAVCCSLSGKCLFSSWLGGWSGNRGECKQPCRRRYQRRGGEGNDGGYYFSPRDLCLLELVPELRRAGVASLKIEGRLRQRDYVGTVVAAYRLALDAESADWEAALAEARGILGACQGREYFHGFVDEASFSRLIRPETSGEAGTPVGRVAETAAGGFRLAATGRLRLGDKIRVQPPRGGDSVTLTVKFLTIDGAPASGVPAGRTCLVGAPPDARIQPGARVYKIGVSLDDMAKRISRLPERPKRCLDMEIAVAADCVAARLVSLPGKPLWRREHPFQTAERRPLDAAIVRAEFAAAASETLMAGDIKVVVDGDYFIPASVLKSLRREFWDWAAATAAAAPPANSAAAGLAAFRRDSLGAPSPSSANLGTPSPSSATLGAPSPSSAMASPPSPPFPRAQAQAQDRDSGEFALPHFTPEGGVAGLTREIRAAHAAGKRRFRLTSLFQLELFEGLVGVSLLSSFPLPAANSFAVRELRGLGFAGAQVWIELGESDIAVMAERAGLPLEMYCFGRPPLMTTRADIPVDGEVRDERGNVFFVQKDDAAGLCNLYPVEPLSVPGIAGVAEFSDHAQTRRLAVGAAKANYGRGGEGGDARRLRWNSSK